MFIVRYFPFLVTLMWLLAQALLEWSHAKLEILHHGQGS
jgi:hypothetical protein